MSYVFSHLSHWLALPSKRERGRKKKKIEKARKGPIKQSERVKHSQSRVSSEGNSIGLRQRKACDAPHGKNQNNSQPLMVDIGLGKNPNLPRHGT